MQNRSWPSVLAKTPLLPWQQWVTAHGRAVNLGPWVKEANQPIARTLKRAFAAWIDNGHHDLQDVNTCIVRIDLTDGALFSHGTRYDIGGE